MKKRAAQALILFTTVGYFLGCYYLLLVIEKDRNVSRDKDDSIWHALDARCVCDAIAANQSSAPSANAKPWDGFKVAVGNGAKQYPSEMCYLNEVQTRNHQTDINTFDIMNDLKVKYPRYIWTHTGWLQQLDATYDAHAWDEEPLQVYVVPFSHHDPGWKSSLESYHSSWTVGTLRTAVKKLLANPQMKFVWAEVIFLQKWFDELGTSGKADFLKVVASEQFEILSGGWVMTDEAVAHYSAMIDQLVEGHNYLANTFNYTVRHAWAIDPFGHSSTMPYLLKKSGVSDMLIQRVHYALKNHLAENKQLEFTWRQSWSASTDTDMHCHLTPFMLYNIVYSCGPDIQVCCWMDFNKNKCWKWGQYQKPEMVNEGNVEKMAWGLLDQLRKKAQFYKHNVVLLPQGDDFRFTTESKWDKHFGNLDKLMQYMNERKDMNVHLRYATLGEYFEASKKALAKMAPKQPESSHAHALPVLSGDFFTYTDRDDQYWSGYYSTRPVLKYMIRLLQSRLRCAEMLYSVGLSYGIKEKDNTLISGLSDGLKHLTYMRQNLALLQHHDAITGTATRSVAKDYLSRAELAVKNGNELINMIASGLLTVDDPTNNLDNFRILEQQRSWDTQPVQLPIELADAESMIALYNSLTVERNEIVRVLIKSAFVKILDADDNPIPCQVNPVLESTLLIKSDLFAIYFTATVPALGFVQYKIKTLSEEEKSKEGVLRCNFATVMMHKSQHYHGNGNPFKVSWSGMRNYEIENLYYKVTFCKCSGLLHSVYAKQQRAHYKAEGKFITYNTGLWYNPLKDKSGAYTFIPDGDATEINPKSVSVAVVTGPLVSYVHSETNLATQILTLYNISGPQGYGLHIENKVDVTEKNNTEIGFRLRTDVYDPEDPVFYTDLNGFQFVKRKTHNRLPIQGNFYPMTTHMFTEGAKSRVSFHSFQGHGVASLQGGALEVILDRRLAQDDWRGLNQGVTDNVRDTTSYFVITFEQRLVARKTRYNTYPSLVSHHISLALNNPILVLQNQAPQLETIPELSPLADQLPCDLHVLNFRFNHERVTLGKNKFLMIIHRLGIDCDISRPFIMTCEDKLGGSKFTSMFSDFDIQSVQETQLTGSDPGESVKEFNVNIENGQIQAYSMSLDLS